MKFITSRIVSPKQTRNLLDILGQNKKEEESIKKVAENKSVKRVVSSEKNTEVKKVEAKKVEVKKASINKKHLQKVEDLQKKISMKKIAKLSDKDKTFLMEYFSRYYPTDYVEALLAIY
jgi:seryl-tRNA synthetase